MKIFKYQRGLMSLALVLILLTNAIAQIDFDPIENVAVQVTSAPATVVSGASAKLVIQISLPPQVHITDREMEFFFVQLQNHDLLTFSEPEYPTGVTYEGETVYRGQVLVTVPMKIAHNLSEGTNIPVSGTLGYQICSEADPIFCTPPVERDFSATVTIGDGSNAGASTVKTDRTDEPSETTGMSIEERTKRALESGSWLALLWIFLGGMALSFTPCVYPVIPITIAFIGARSGGSRLKGFSLSLVFVLGLGLVYSILGVVAAATGGVFGLSTQNPWVIGFVSVVFLVMGIGMMGAFEISLPSSMQTKLASKKRSGYLGALFVGGTTGLVAAPCVGPVLVALLSWVSSSGNLFLGFLYLFVFAAGLGTLFVVIGTFAGAVSALPRAGGWMDSVKVVFGVILIAAALYFGQSLMPENLFTILVGLAILMLAGLLGAFSRLPEDTGLGSRISRGLARFIVVLGVFYTLLGLARMEGFDPAKFSLGSSAATVVETSEHGKINWIHDEIEAALGQAQNNNQPIIIDFWAEWCAACKELDHKTFSDETIASYVNEHYVALKIDGTKITADIKSIWARFGVKGLPTVLFLNSQGEEQDRFEAFRTVAEVRPILEANSR